MKSQLSPLLIISLAFLFIFAGFTGSRQYITSFFTELGQPQFGFYSLILVYFAFILGNPLSVVFIAKYGAKKAMLVGGIMYVVFILALTTKNIWFISLSSILLGISAAFIWTGNNSYLTRIATKQTYGTNAGFFTTLLSLGQGSGVIFTGMLISRFSFIHSFLICAISTLVGVCLLIALPEVPINKSSNQLALLKQGFKSPTILKISSIWFSFNLVAGLVIGIVPLMITRTLGTAYIGLSSIFFIMPVILSYLLGKASDSQGRNKMIFLSLVLGIVGLAFLLLNAHPITLISGILLLSLTSAAIFPITLALLGDIAVSKNLEVMTALFWMVQNIGVVLALFLSSLYYLNTEPRTVRSRDGVTPADFLQAGGMKGCKSSPIYLTASTTVNIT